MTTKKHQGQITAFIVVGILILVLTGILVGLYVSNEQPLKGKETISTLSFDSAAIENALNACLQKASGEAIALLSKQGGYIYTFPHLTFYDGWQVAYHYDNGRDISPTKQFMEGEMSRYAAEALLACASNSFLPLYEGATIKKPMVITAIEDGLVVFEVEFPITIQKDRSTITISKLYHNIPVRLQHVLDVKQQILNSIRNNNHNNNNDNTLRLDELSSYDVDITLLQTDGKTRIYSIKDQSSALSENSVLLFNFAVRQPTTAPPQLQFIPDVIIDAGQEYNLVAKADDPDSSSIQFSIKNGPGMIEPDTGRYFFTPTSPGIQTATICASDGSLEDCETFMITVKEQIIT